MNGRRGSPITFDAWTNEHGWVGFTVHDMDGFVQAGPHEHIAVNLPEHEGSCLYNGDCHHVCKEDLEDIAIVEVGGDAPGRPWYYRDMGPPTRERK